MGKNKGKKTLKGDDGALLEMSPAYSVTYENPRKHASQTDKDSCVSDSSKRDETLTCSSVKSKKKRKKIDLHAQEDEKKDSELQTNQENGNLKKRTPTKDTQGCMTHSDKVSQRGLDDADWLSGETSLHEAPPRKKKKKEKLELQKENVSGISTKKVKKSSKKNKSVDPHEVEYVTMELEESESKSKEKSEKRGKKRKKNKVKYKDCSDLAKTTKKPESAATAKHTPNIPNEINQMLGDLISPTRQVDTGFTTKKNKRGSAREVDPYLLEELKEFVPNVESYEPGEIIKMINYDLPRYKDFKKRGIPLNHGRFTMKESDRLRNNVEDFMALTGIDSATKLFFPHRFKEEQERIKKLKKLHRFFEKIADGIARSCHKVYARGRRSFDGSNHKGQFSKSEIHTLLKLHTLHGNNWTKISELTGRSALALEKRYAQLTVKEGPWSKKEVQRLLQAVQEHIVTDLKPGGTINSIRVSRETLYRKLPWKNISAKVKTRCWTKCREKWMSLLAVKMSSGTVQMGKKSNEVKVKLIKAMYEMQVDDVAFVNWEDLTAVFGDVPPAYVQRKWHKLKVCHVPHWQSKCFADTIDFLYENVLPHFEKELTNYGNDETEKEDQQESFLLSHIFQDID